jgi:hypothetical protein
VNPGRSAFAAEEGPAFLALFRNKTAESHSPLSPAVRELWGSFDGASRGLAGVATTGGAKAPAAVGEPLNILSHLKRG